jgi:hypothetical protein
MVRDRRLFLRTALSGLLAGFGWAGGNARASDEAADCYVELGMTAPPHRENAVALVDGSTALSLTQQTQAKDLLLSMLRPGSSLALYTFARGPGAETVQRVGTFGLPAAVDDQWRIGSHRANTINKCVGERRAPLMEKAGRAIESVLSGYRHDPDGESPIVQALMQLVASHPTATRIVVVSDGVQNARSSYSLYAPVSAQRSQAIRKFDPKVEVERLASVALPPLNPGVVVNIFPVGQPEPTAEGVINRRFVGEVDRLIELWRLYLAKCGAAPGSTVTSFVPAG